MTATPGGPMTATPGGPMTATPGGPMTATATPLQRLLAAIPPALLIGLALGVIGDLVLQTYGAYLTRQESLEATRLGWARLSVASLALSITVTVTVAVGLRELARRVPRGDAIWFYVAIALLAIVTVRTTGNLYVRYFATTDRRAEWIADWYRWGARLAFVAWLGVAAAVGVALRRHRNVGLVVGLAIALVVTAMVNFPTQQLYEWLHFDDRRADGLANLFIDTVAALAHAGTLVAAVFLLGDGALPAPADPMRSAQGIARVGTALVARIVIAMALAGFTLMAIGGRSPGLLKLTLTVIPAAILLAMIAMVSGMFQAGGPARPDAPRLRFAAAGALSLASLVMTVIQAVAAYRLARHQLARNDELDSYARHSLEAAATAFPYLGPAIALAGLLCLISALASLRREHGDALGTADPTTAAVMLVLFTVATVAIQQWAASERRDLGTYLMLTIITTIATIVAQLAVARLCHKVAEGLLYATPSGLPPARIHRSAADDLED